MGLIYFYPNFLAGSEFPPRDTSCHVEQRVGFRFWSGPDVFVLVSAIKRSVSRAQGSRRSVEAANRDLPIYSSLQTHRGHGSPLLLVRRRALVSFLQPAALKLYHRLLKPHPYTHIYIAILPNPRK
jgi:hypothetical protein